MNVSHEIVSGEEQFESIVHIVHTIASLQAASGGTSRSAAQLCKHLAARKIKVTIVTTGAAQAEGYHSETNDGILKIINLQAMMRIGLKPLITPGFKRTLKALIEHEEISLIHDHGIWLPTNWISVNVAYRASVPVVVSTRGMVDPWAMNFRSTKKRLAWNLYQRRCLNRVTMFHATSEVEADYIRAMGFRQPIAVVPNGVELPEQSDTADRSTGDEQRMILFLSRVHPKKGLLMLVEALRRIQPRNWQVVIAGPDEGGHQRQVQHMVDKAGLNGMTRFVGPIDDRAKWQLYKRADVFVLPSHSENFGIVVAEALGSGTPVITTKATPWRDIAEYNCGWWIDTNADALTCALRQAMNTPPESIQEMGERGKALILEKYTWDRAADSILLAYQWLAGYGNKPECVHIV